MKNQKAAVKNEDEHKWTSAQILKRSFNITLAVVLLAVITLAIIADQQEKFSYQQYMTFKSAAQAYQKGSASNGLSMISQVDPQYSSMSAEILSTTAVMYASVKQYDIAQEYYDRALAVDARMYSNASFLLQYASNQYHLGNIDMANVYLQYARFYSTDGQLNYQINQLYEEINKPKG